MKRAFEIIVGSTAKRITHSGRSSSRSGRSVGSQQVNLAPDEAGELHQAVKGQRRDGGANAFKQTLGDDTEDLQQAYDTAPSFWA